MKTIQEVGTEILSNQPRSIYIFTGHEYGIKTTYIEHLRNHYGEKIEAPSVADVVNIMSSHHLIPLKPAVYVVRYDEEFLSALDEAYANKLRRMKMIGTLVCVYEDERGIGKISKFLPDVSVEIPIVSQQFVRKYLRQMFPNLPDRLTNLAAKIGDNYSDAINMCRSFAHCDQQAMFKLSDQEISSFFGKHAVSNDDDVKRGVASRNFEYLLDVFNKYPDDLDRFLYSMLSALIELDKVTELKRSNSPLQSYADRWTKQDIYNMFMNVYNELIRLRTYATDKESSIIYLLGLMQFRQIPLWEDA